jgi:glycosyltransferase involved in cell wall biosynthesis
VPNGRGRGEELRGADVFVDPAVADMVPAAPLLAAQACGIPFVATGRPGLPGDAGIAVPRRNPPAIAEALARLAGDPALRARMGRAGRARARSFAALQADHLRRLENLYRRLLNRRRPG